MRTNAKKFLKKLQVTSEAIPIDQVFDKFKQSFEDILSHINVKGIQGKAFQDDLTDPNTRVPQIDYAMAYQCKHQNEIQSALWSRESVNLFTCAVFHQSITKPLLICINYKGKEKFANGTLLAHLYKHEILKDENVVKEVI